MAAKHQLDEMDPIQALREFSVCRKIPITRSISLSGSRGVVLRGSSLCEGMPFMPARFSTNFFGVGGFCLSKNCPRFRKSYSILPKMNNNEGLDPE